MIEKETYEGMYYLTITFGDQELSFEFFYFHCLDRICFFNINKS